MVTSGTQIWGLSGPAKHSWFTPLKGVHCPISSQHLHDGHWHHADACHLLHPQHNPGPLCAGFAVVGSKIYCMHQGNQKNKKIVLYFKHLTSYVQCLWSPLLSDWGVLVEPFVTVLYIQ